MRNNFKNLLTAMVVTSILVAVGFVFGTTFTKLQNDKIQTINNLIKSNFYGNIDENFIAENLVGGLQDKYSYYLDRDTYQKLIFEDQGKYVGIGLNYLFENGKVRVLNVYENTPAQKAGIIAGNLIIKINNIEVATLKNPDEVQSLFKGKEDQEIILLVENEKPEGKEVRLKRVSLQLPSLVLRKLKDDIYYLKIFKFNENTTEEFNKVFENIKPEDLNNLIIDLRNNLGGDTEAALFIDKQFIVEGVLLKEIYKNQKEVITNANKSAKYKNTNIVILVNKETSSAAEEVASAFRDNDRAKIIGEVTYGKSVFGNYFELKDGSAVHLTTGHWLRPNGESIRNVGIKPDLEVQDIVTGGQDNMLEKAEQYFKIPQQ